LDPYWDPATAIFVIDLQDANKKIIFLTKFFCLLLFERTFLSLKKSQNSKNQGFFTILFENRRLIDPDPEHWYLVWKVEKSGQMLMNGICLPCHLLLIL
jgi:hypothetical protein